MSTLDVAKTDLIDNPWPTPAKRTAQLEHWLLAQHTPADREALLDWARAATDIDIPREYDPEPAEDVVNHPSHYKTGRFEAIEVLEDFGLTRDGRLFNVGKYILRAGKKDDELQDLKKAVWYLNRYIAEVEATK